MSRIILEVCVASADDALAAQRAGADRIELNCALEVGGLTPSLGLLRETLAAVSVPVIVMVRPRAGSFIYSEREQRIMRLDAEAARAAGAHGIATGALTPELEIDRALLEQLPRPVVFHRAFDLISDQSAALEQLIQCEVVRVLTSGGAATALTGVDRVAQLVQQAGDRIEVLAGAGINAGNVLELLRRTGVRSIHGTFRHHQSRVPDSLGFGQEIHADPAAIAEVRRLLDGI